MSPTTTARVLINTVPTATFQRSEPATDLRAYVAFYWQSQPLTDLYSYALPTYTTLFSFNLQQCPWYSESPTGARVTFTRSQVFGHLTQARRCHYPAGTTLFGVTLQPGALALLLGQPTPPLADWCADLADVLPITLLEEALRSAPIFAERVALVEPYLRTLLPAEPLPYRYPLVQHALARLTEPSGASPCVAEVAKQLNVTPKSLLSSVGRRGPQALCTTRPL
jgi:hypothetical protein